MQALWTHVIETVACPSTPSACVWTEALPCLTRKLLRNAADVAYDHQRELEKLQSEADQVHNAEERARNSATRAQHYADEADAMEEAHEAEVARLNGELREAKGREEALQGVIAQWMSARGA